MREREVIITVKEKCVNGMSNVGDKSAFSEKKIV